MFLNFLFFSYLQVLLFIFCDFRILALSVIGVSTCLFNFRMRGCKSWGGFVPTMHYKSISHKYERGGLLVQEIINVHKFINEPQLLYHVATWTSHVATSCFTFSATSQRGNSRRDVNFYKPLPHRDVDFQRRDVKLYTLCHVAT